MADDIDKIGRTLALARGGTPLENIQANLDRLSGAIANRLPEDVGFVVVLFNKRDRDLNAVASDLETPDVIEKLKRVRDQLRQGGIKMGWSKDLDVLESRIVRMS